MWSNNREDPPNIILGRSSVEDNIEPNYRAVQKQVAEFNTWYGATYCEQLLGGDLPTEEGQQKFKYLKLSYR